MISEEVLDSLSEKELLALMYELEKDLYATKPVDIDTFLTDDYYLGESGKALFPKVKEQIIKFQSDPDVFEVVFAGSTGWGKSFGTTISVIYDLYKLSTLKNPQRFYGLSADTEIVFITTATTGKTANSTIFASVKSMIDNSPYFREKFPRDPDLESTLKFPNKISFHSGNSSENSAIGQNVFSAIIDEANFLEAAKMSKIGKSTTEDGSQATVLYNSLQRRLKGRFMKSGRVPGKIYLVSSAVHPKDFLSRRIEDAVRTNDKSVYVVKFAQWETKPEGTYCGETFRVMVGNELIPSKILLTGEDVPEGFQVIDVPIEYWTEFERDIVGSLRDIAGVGVAGKNKFIGNGTKVKEAFFTEYSNPTMSEVLNLGLNDDIGTIDKWIRQDELHAISSITRKYPHYIHVDMAVKGDRLGLAMVHPFVSEGRHKVRTDLYVNIKAKKGDEIPLHHIRHFILNLRDKYKFKIARVSFDQFQSVDSQQILKKAHFEVQQISVDRTAIPYKTLKNMIYAGDVEMYEHSILVKELLDLEHDTVKDKIDHPAVGSDGLAGSKDLADAVTGAIASVAMDYDMTHYDQERQMAVIDLVHQMYKEELGIPDGDWLIEDSIQDINSLREFAFKLGASAVVREVPEGTLIKLTYKNHEGKPLVKTNIVQSIEEGKQVIRSVIGGG
jgi:hypothetical protein